MTDENALIAEVQPDLAALTNALFDASEAFVAKRGNFLPHAAVLTAEGEIRLVSATPENDLTNSVELLPLIHDALRREAAAATARAVATAESVTVTQAGGRPTKAIKVLVEHSRGISFATYLPFEKKLLRGYVFGAPFSVRAQPEVNPWPKGGT